MNFYDTQKITPQLPECATDTLTPLKLLLQRLNVLVCIEDYTYFKHVEKERRERVVRCMKEIKCSTLNEAIKSDLFSENFYRLFSLQTLKILVHSKCKKNVEEMSILFKRFDLFRKCFRII